MLQLIKFAEPKFGEQNISTPWYQQLSRYVSSKVIEILEEKVRKYID